MLHFIAPPMPHFTVGGEDTYAPGRSHPDRSNIGVFDLIYVTKGELALAENGAEYRLADHHFVILRPDAAHRTVMPCREETHFYWLHFQTQGAWTEVIEQQPVDLSQSVEPYSHIEKFSFYIPKTAHLAHPDPALSIIQQILAFQGQSTSEAKWKQQTAFQELLLALREEGDLMPKSRQLQIAEAAALYLRNHYRETVSYEQLSRHVHFHENYISLCMKQTFGCTPLDYLIRYRIAQAKRLLIRTNDPIGAIAEATGFGSFPYFVRCFVKHTGKRPNAFRKQFRQ